MEKSENFSYLKRSYCAHKHGLLVKPFTVCTTTGYVIDMFGRPYDGKSSDAKILMELFQQNTAFRNLFNPGDIMVLDRGFRDATTFLESMNIQVEIIAFKGNAKQFSCTDANKNRAVSKVRWVVGAVHGIIKQKYR
ncbi:hypothetical protein B4U80_00650 [Leptotrombidium deliense]|uniref:DDE Tnp4 domain-containing protein n=1 Tax=Leptotrombidium deliense TaxID=299467 RepID=A0A443SB41_9ACAR|nr:hypothetical protein B4U80_00650 [Leptotrombidium deliense]